MALAFLPWYAYASPIWNETVKSTGIHFHISWKTPLMLVREITGAGYIGGCAIILLAIIGSRRGITTLSLKWLLVLCAVIPVICVLVADAAADYFLAIRQMIFVLPPLLLLASDGLSTLMHVAPRRTAALIGALTIFFVVQDVRWLLKPRENWQLAATTIKEMRTEHDACTLYAPPDSLSYYAFFEPGLADTVCPLNQSVPGPVVLAISPYAAPVDFARVEERFSERTPLVKRTVGMSTIEVFR
jgi:hypothetical protein